MRFVKSAKSRISEFKPKVKPLFSVGRYANSILVSCTIETYSKTNSLVELRSGFARYGTLTEEIPYLTETILDLLLRVCSDKHVISEAKLKRFQNPNSAI